MKLLVVYCILYKIIFLIKTKTVECINYYKYYIGIIVTCQEILNK